MLRLLAGMMVLAMAFLGTAYSQDKSDDKTPTKIRGQLPMYFGKLGLRDDQKQKVYKLRADYKSKTDQLKRQLEKLKYEEKEALETVLTQDQLKRLKELRTGEKSTETIKSTDKAKSTDKGKSPDKGKSTDKPKS
jgi:hypothetical protein